MLIHFPKVIHFPFLKLYTFLNYTHWTVYKNYTRSRKCLYTFLTFPYTLSLHKNYELLYELIKALQILSHVICITEICIKNQPLSNLDLPNYCFVHVNTTTNVCGVTIYVSDNLKHKVCENQNQLCNSEALWVNIIYQNDSSYAIKVIYRHLSKF